MELMVYLNIIDKKRLYKNLKTILYCKAYN